MLDKTALYKILITWNETDAPFASDKMLHELFEQQASKQPNAIAVKDNDISLTYGELQSKTNQLAHFLQQRLGTKPEQFIAVNLERSHLMVVAVLGILKAGGSYVPLETNWPSLRKQQIVDNLSIQIILTDASQKHALESIQQIGKSIKHIICLGAQPIKSQHSETLWQSLQEEWQIKSQLGGDDAHSSYFYSSYSGLPFSQQDIKQYQNHVLKLCKNRVENKRRVLEIGSGSGLLLLPLTQLFDEAIGLDPAPNLTTTPNNLTMINGFAHELEKLNGTFDLILLSSTVQFFPDYQYLRDILRKAYSLLAKRGVLIIADIPNAVQKRQLIDDIAAYRQKHLSYQHATTPSFDKLLFVNPDFFTDVIQDASFSTEIEFIQHNDFENELKFRYDVIIKKVNSRTKPTHDPLRHFYQWAQSHIDQYSKKPLELSKTAPDRIAYIIHTSGSTGTPKGVMVQHSPVINVIEWVNKTFSISSSSKVLATASLAFDLSVYDIFGLLAAGGMIRLVTHEQVKDPNVLKDIIRADSITLWNSAPGVMKYLIDTLKINDNATIFPSLKHILLSGDWIPLSLPQAIEKRFPNSQTISLGGATEATIWSNYFIINHVNPNWSSIPYGRPIQNAKYYILDESLQPVAIGMVGELYIGGVCLAKGYINASKEDHARFIINPFIDECDENNNRLYRTGDLARYDDKGIIEFLGRKDQQIKLRGHRVECGEIESVIQQHPAIKETIVLANKVDGETILTAFITLEDIQ